jgi:hypothetical protein
MERVTTIRGSLPILFIAPHGFDDKHTDTLAEAAAEEIGAYAVINRGWERADKVDDLKSKANCNNIDHIYEDVVSDEFLDPIDRYYSQIVTKHGGMYYFVIHGCGNIGTDPNLSAILGYGDGNKPSLTCSLDMRCYFHNQIKSDGLWTIWHAGPGSKFSGWDRKNLNQFWRKHQEDADVLGFQLEFVTAVRKTKADAEMSGKYLGSVVNRMVKSTWPKGNSSTFPVYP